MRKDEYSVKIYAKEYKLGKFKKEYSLFEDKVQIENKEALSIGLYENEDNLFSGINGGFISNTLEFFNKSYDRGMAMSILDNEIELKLNKEIPIAVYSIGKENEGATSVYLSEDFELGINENDLLICLKVNNVN
ncbi:hypothetical protein [Terrisporobacter sp.]|uniref:hypothetical protein n=1 Tax=Terrisporobacter sp. TaxID=1965305 RepID=UPI002FCC3B79